ncbi:MAG TPA: mechanosensitive ion channel family protein [Deltaproteobacteria bacterium]|nr:mechanosensitive ion channel family protein [Deltaproteobacteria bacterium]
MITHFEEVLRNFWLRITHNYTKLLVVIAKLLLLCLAALMCWWIFKKILSRLTPVLNRFSFFEKNPKVIDLMKRAGGYIILVALGVISLNVLKLPFLEKFFYAGLILGLAGLVVQTVKLLVRYLEENVASKTETKFDDIVIDLVDKFSAAIIYTLAVVMALDFLGVNVMPFIAGAGVASLAIGFAAKDTLSNLIAGVLLLIDRPFEVGDRIEVWSAPKNASTWGDVLDIGLRATKIRTTDNIIIIIPNNEIMTRDIINYTTISEEIRVRIPIGVAYESDIDRAKKVILDIIGEMDWTSSHRPPRVVVRNLGDFFVELQARVWIKDARRRMDTIDYVVDRVKEAFERNGIEIPYPKREIYMHTTEDSSTT